MKRGLGLKKLAEKYNTQDFQAAWRSHRRMLMDERWDLLHGEWTQRVGASMEAEALLGGLDGATVTDTSGVDWEWILVIFWSELAHTSLRLTALFESLVSSSSTLRLGASCKPARPGQQEGSGVRPTEPSPAWPTPPTPAEWGPLLPRGSVW